MKAIIKYYDQWGGKRQATVEIETNEPNSIPVKAMKTKKISPWDVVRTIRCGQREYQWMGRAKDAMKEA